MRMLLFLLAFTTVSIHAAQHIPMERTFPEAWQSAGYPGEIPSPATIKNVRDFGAVGNGVTDDRLAIQNAINSFGGQPGVVYFPAGTYLCNERINLVSGVVLRGERTGNTTILLGTFISDHIIKSVGTAGATQSVTGGYNMHSSTIEVANGSAFAAGDLAEIYQTNDPAMGIPAGYDNSVGQMIRIASVTGNTLTLVNPLRFTFKAAQNPLIRKVTPIQNVGIENLRVARQVAGDNTTRNNKHTIHFSFAANCWVRGVEGTNGFGANVGVERSTKLTISGCYFHSPYEVDGGGSGYGTKMQFHPGECLIENSIFRKLRHSMSLHAGANGNVLGYNYSREQTRTETYPDFAADINLHGSYAFGNLFEGNIVQNIQADANSGANGPFNTFVRNRAEYGGINITDNGCTNVNLVGNETYTSPSLWALLYDGWLLKGSGNFAHGNNTQSDGVQAPGTTTLSDYSYYLTNDPSILPSVPVYWNITNEFPTIGLPLTRTAIKEIPARARYFAGGSLTVGPPSLAKQPTNFTAQVGATAAFSVQATGTPVAVFAWFRNGVALPDQTNATCSLPNVQLADAGDYDVLITDGHPYSVRSTVATLTVEGSDDMEDADLNGLPDAWETMFAGTADSDTDGDGFTKRQEYVLGTIPTNTTSRLEIQIDQTSVRFPTLATSGPGYTGLERYYDLEYCADLFIHDWQPVLGYTNILGDGNEVIYALPTTGPAGFYRAKVRLQ